MGVREPSLLAGAFPKEVHGHGVTLVPLGALICVDAGALLKQTVVLHCHNLYRSTGPFAWM